MQWAPEVFSHKCCLSPWVSYGTQFVVLAFSETGAQTKECLDFEDLIRKIPVSSCMSWLCIFFPLEHLFLDNLLSKRIY